MTLTDKCQCHEMSNGRHVTCRQNIYTKYKTISLNFSRISPEISNIDIIVSHGLLLAPL